MLWLGEHGYDPIYGARPLRRLVQSAIGDSLAKALLAGEILDGDTVVVDLNERQGRPDGPRRPDSSMQKGPRAVERGPSLSARLRLPLPVGVGHEDVREGVLAVRRTRS